MIALDAHHTQFNVSRKNMEMRKKNQNHRFMQCTMIVILGVHQAKNNKRSLANR